MRKIIASDDIFDITSALHNIDNSAHVAVVSPAWRLTKNVLKHLVNDHRRILKSLTSVQIKCNDGTIYEGIPIGYKGERLRGKVFDYVVIYLPSDIPAQTLKEIMCNAG